MKDWISIILMMAGTVLVVGGVTYGLWLINPVFGIVFFGICIGAIGKSLGDTDL